MTTQPDPAAPATTAMVIQELTDLRDWMQSSPTPVYVPTIPLLQSAITHLTALSERCAALEEDKAKTISNTCEAIRTELKRASAGEVHTWGFVAAFMDIINRTEKEMLK